MPQIELKIKRALSLFSIIIMTKKLIIILPIVIILTMGCSIKLFSLQEDTKDKSINTEIIKNPIDDIVYNRIIVDLDADENMLLKELGDSGSVQRSYLLALWVKVPPLQFPV